MNQKLTPEAVREVMLACLFQQEEIDANSHVGAVMVEGLVNTFGFHPGRVAEKKPEIAALLAQLPEAFFSDSGGGMSFLNACVDKDGDQWGEHRDMEALFALGQAVGLVTCPLSRAFWSSLPGGVPYFMVNADKVRALQM